MKKEEGFLHPLLYGVMVVYILLTFLTLLLGDKAVALLIPEDHYFENVGAASLFIASLLFFYCFFRSLRPDIRGEVFWLKKLVYLGLALLFFFGAGEEISWGQRIFGFSTPASLTDINTQDEFNIHNLGLFEESELFTADRFFDVFWFFFAVAVPAVILGMPKLKTPATRLLPVVPWALGLLFLWDYAVAKAARVLFAGSYTFMPVRFPQAVQEIKESNYSLLFILAGLFAVWELKRGVGSRDQA